MCNDSANHTRPWQKFCLDYLRQQATSCMCVCVHVSVCVKIMYVICNNYLWRPCLTHTYTLTDTHTHTHTQRDASQTHARTCTHTPHSQGTSWAPSFCFSFFRNRVVFHFRGTAVLHQALPMELRFYVDTVFILKGSSPIGTMLRFQTLRHHASKKVGFNTLLPGQLLHTPPDVMVE
jgi:hypothetical protein